jgi:hypothetical protein
MRMELLLQETCVDCLHFFAVLLTYDQLLIRGPSIGKDLRNAAAVPGGNEEHWVTLGVKAAVQTNGTFRVESGWQE